MSFSHRRLTDHSSPAHKLAEYQALSLLKCYPDRKLEKERTQYERDPLMRLTNPPGDRQEYNRFLEKLIPALHLISGRSYTRGAVENQIAWGTQKGQKECKNKGFLASFILNRAAALDAGLITIGDIPNSASFISDARV
jgi:hypothetical protein